MGRQGDAGADRVSVSRKTLGRTRGDRVERDATTTTTTTTTTTREARARRRRTARTDESMPRSSSRSTPRAYCNIIRGREVEGAGDRRARPSADARTTVATFEGSRSFDEIARASYPSFASSRREGVVLRLGQPWVNPGLTCRRRAIVCTLSPPCFACLLASASARGSVCAARLGDDDRASRRANARARVHRRAHRFKRIRTRFLSFVFVSC